MGLIDNSIGWNNFYIIIEERSIHNGYNGYFDDLNLNNEILKNSIFFKNKHIYVYIFLVYRLIMFFKFHVI